ncbi:hypothetical protein A2757_02780 [Candidatus Giovannonibacteria bacterium RIFCSPHIGHO2_01_FULL_48_47]|nr:MAG: hypothetical protein A2757_02780 [Candidatus Giovannonibacteria bacterium RIFCSPHIGHO2_01_FULL_48_47]OGF88660.1 MAG: hypothetical protein A3B26_03405 [Candidatus Giovannonibacteria bacterium RIFCSPLOWO2_01_FULL_48_47]
MNLKGIWNVHIPKRVAKAISRFPERDRDRILEIFREFKVNPWGGDIVKIKDEDNKWRRRVGSYRVFYSVYSERKLIEVKEVRRRNSKTY